MNDDVRNLDRDDSFKSRLRAGLHHIAEGTPAGSPGEFDPDVAPLIIEEPRPRRLALALSAAAAVAVTVTGLAVVSAREGEPAQSNQPPPTAPEASDGGTAPTQTAEPSPSTGRSPDGAVVFDETPSDLASATVTAGDRFEPRPPTQVIGDESVVRWYTATMSRPEAAPHLSVESVIGEPSVPDDATVVTVQGVDGKLYDDPVSEGRSVTFELGDAHYVVTGGNMTDEDLLLAAGHVRRADDGYGAVVDPAGLTNGLVERATGTTRETNFISMDAHQHRSPQISWADHDREVTFWVLAITEDPDLLPLHRIGYESVTDTTVHGQPAFATTLSFQPEYNGVTWSENGITYLAGSNGLDQATVIDYANRLRPATATEWEQLVRQTEQQIAANEEVAATVTTVQSR